jgi:hypothetical protein
MDEMKRLLILVLLFSGSTSAQTTNFNFRRLFPVPQTLTFPALSTNNTFTGTNTFQANTTVQNLTILGTCTGCFTNPFSGQFNILAGGGLGLNIVTTGTNGIANFSSSSFAGAVLGISIQSPGKPTITGDSGTGASQVIINSNNFEFIPHDSGGAFEFGATGGEFQATSDTGVIGRYFGRIVVRGGVSAIRANVDQTAEVTGNSGVVGLLTPTIASSVFDVEIYTVVSTGVAGSTIQWTVSYTDVTGSRTQIGTSIAGDTLGTNNGQHFLIEAETSGLISISASTSMNPKYKYFVRLEEK